MVVPEDLGMCYPDDYYTHSPDPGTNQDTEGSKLVVRRNGFRAQLRESVVASIQGKSPNGLTGIIGRIISKSRSIRERAFYGVLLDELLPPHSDRPRALEIGCGSGALLANLSSVGWDAMGMEWDAKAARVAEKNSGCNVVVGDAKNLEFGPESFDLVVLHHVFEHLPDPIGTLKAVKTILAPAGEVVLIYPNPNSLGAKVFDRDWFPWDPPRHLSFAPFQAMHAASRDLGFAFSARTTSRMAEYCSAKSRRYRSGHMDDGYETSFDRWDFLFKRIEGALVYTGFQVGEEILVVLRKSNPSMCD